jgi:hypothetical protein
VKIFLNSALTGRHYELLLKYATDPRSLAREEWPEALTAFDLLRDSRVEWEGKVSTFAQFYEVLVEAKYARPFLEQLQQAHQPERQGPRLVREYMQRIVADLAAQGCHATDTLPERCLLAYVVYWWGAFGRGYTYEVMIFADLEREGIAFSAHDLLDPVERRSPFDLVVSDFVGDIKTSAYFLRVARSFPLRHDLYITRLFHPAPPTWHEVVILKRAAWIAIDGPTCPASLEDAPRLLPAVTEVGVENEKLVIAPYAQWKARIKVYQRPQEIEHGEEDVC